MENGSLDVLAGGDGAPVVRVVHEFWTRGGEVRNLRAELERVRANAVALAACVEAGLVGFTERL